MFAVSASATERGIRERQARQAAEDRRERMARHREECAEDRRIRCELYHDRLARERLIERVKARYVRPVKIPLTVRAIMLRFEAWTGLDRGDLAGPVRTHRIVRVRHAAIYWARRRLPQRSLPEIGKVFGGRDHTTSLHACRKHVERRASQGRHLRPVIGKGE